MHPARGRVRMGSKQLQYVQVDQRRPIAAHWTWNLLELLELRTFSDGAEEPV